MAELARLLPQLAMAPEQVGEEIRASSSFPILELI
jgi:hypothetical protein